MLIALILIILIFGSGGGWYGNSQWGLMGGIGIEGSKITKITPGS